MKRLALKETITVELTPADVGVILCAVHDLRREGGGSGWDHPAAERLRVKLADAIQAQVFDAV